MLDLLKSKCIRVGSMLLYQNIQIHILVSDFADAGL